MPLFYHNYVNYVLAHSVNYVITLYSFPSRSHKYRSKNGTGDPSPAVIYGDLKYIRIKSSLFIYSLKYPDKLHDFY